MKKKRRKQTEERSVWTDTLDPSEQFSGHRHWNASSSSLLPYTVVHCRTHCIANWKERVKKVKEERESRWKRLYKGSSSSSSSSRHRLIWLSTFRQTAMVPSMKMFLVAMTYIGGVKSTAKDGASELWCVISLHYHHHLYYYRVCSLRREGG